LISDGISLNRFYYLYTLNWSQPIENWRV
jgi:hypothetical protein